MEDQATSLPKTLDDYYTEFIKPNFDTFSEADNKFALTYWKNTLIQTFPDKTEVEIIHQIHKISFT